MSKKGKRAKERLKAKKEKQKKIFFGVVGGVVAVLVVLLLIFVNANDNDDSSIIDPGAAPEQAQVSEDWLYTYAKVTDVSDNDLHFYKYSASNGKIARYFIVKGGDNKFHAAIDLCQKMHPERSGWRQEGDYIVCKDEGCAYPINSIGSEQPGCCWPVTLPFEIVGDEFQIKTEHLEDAATYF